MQIPGPKIDPALFRKTLGHWASGVTVITTLFEGTPHGMTASAFCSLSLDPPLVMVSVGQSARMHRMLGQTGLYGVSILAEGQEQLSQHFAGKPQDGLRVPFVWQDGVPLIHGAVAHLICRIVDAHPAGDHTLYIGQVEHLEYVPGTAPLLYYTGRYRALADLERR